MSARTFTARYDGRCAACGEVVNQGDTLTWDDDQAVHAACEYAVNEKTARPTCPKCWLEISPSGVCGCDE